MAEALVLAQKEGLSPTIKESFARAGTAHLLAISGFHVGVVAGLLLLAGGWLGLAHSTRFLVGSLGVWGYVLFIGLPDAALRAALFLTLFSLGRLRRRSVAPQGALASAFLLFLLLDPGALLRPGFQLSFAGALGLLAWARPLSRRLSKVGPFRVPPALSTGVAAGVSATLATLPLVVWHFGRVSLVGIPVTLLAAPLVTLAIPGILLSLLASLPSPALGSFLAQGVELDLWLFARMVEWAGDLPFASVWVSRPGLVAGVVGVGVASLALRFRPRPGSRMTFLAVGALAGLILWPAADLVMGRGTVELVVLDVGQGDALLLRSPLGRWILVDAGPRTDGYDAGARAVLPYLRRRGAGALELLVLTHPDMDHVGGAGAILGEHPVGGVVDPGVAAGTEAFLDALEGARGMGVPWRVGEAGDSLELDGVALRILWPPGAEARADPGTREFMEAVEAEDGANALSLVLELRYGDFSALLTGDAPAAVEEALLPRILSPRIQVLKVGHHGSRTSTSPQLLERISPEVALVSVGGRNRYGHPHLEILRRLEAGGVGVFRTDRLGTLTLRAGKDGRFEVRGEWEPRANKSIPVDPRVR
jgi:competence protein ComEC